uniref:Uncharacterized protein n=1 Tax=Anguilla anguilla TaxID=7936 RepID=A0A0E9X279_ANGAN
MYRITQHCFIQEGSLNYCASAQGQHPKGLLHYHKTLEISCSPTHPGNQLHNKSSLALS